MWYKKGSWHTLLLRDSEMLPEALATTSLWPSWLRLQLMADGRATGGVGLGRRRLGEVAATFLCLG